MKTLNTLLLLLILTCALYSCNHLSDLEDLISESREKNVFTMSAIITTDQSTPPNSFLVYATGSSGNLQVHWGDGTTTSYTLGGSTQLEKIYSSPGRYEIRVTGDVQNIESFSSAYGQGVFDKINLRSLKSLRSLRVGSASAAVFDLTHNLNLVEVSLTGIPELKEVWLPKNHSISTLSIAGPNKLPTLMVDLIIHNVYTVAKRKEIYNGYINVMKLYYEDSEVNKDLVGPPSAESIRKLEELRDSLNWEVVPLSSTSPE